MVRAFLLQTVGLAAFLVGAWLEHAGIAGTGAVAVYVGLAFEGES